MADYQEINLGNVAATINGVPALTLNAAGGYTDRGLWSHGGERKCREIC